ncbi:type II secretion system F family protein [Amycolatopsis sp. PS_44_ISF1]|uniref:type II secretion system F family protein n=1 Tax=Amycolatopsis sp. PS_44_ISF1 TaxID=2974917 RepID=UPI0028DEA4E0|nr:type II secretion system F family protein [Amycolatopsis sp. PS_44_ISF1]MDT8910927.1 type II secretion system F family protein [Amycolatopsis sp. PS_44_ISF1]
MVLVAAALMIWPSAVRPRHLAPPPAVRLRLPRPPAIHLATAVAAGVSVMVFAGVVAGAIVGLGGWWALRRSHRRKDPDTDVAERLRSAATLDTFAACLRTGLPVPVALEAVSRGAPPETAKALRSTASLLALGAEPAQAWAPTRARPGLDELAVAATRTARSGTTLATTADELARRLRDGLGVEAEERAERAGVALALPVGLCFLPAFFCLGVLPVVLGLAERIGSRL